MDQNQLRRLVLVPVLAVVAFFSATTAAGAHIQVTPSLVATADPVLFTVLVPGETSSGTVRVELKIPPGLYPFSYEDVPGWKRQVITKANGLTDRVVWTGQAAPDGFARFSFLAGTPEKDGELRWAAIQTYADGKVVNWIGPPESENPAAITEVSSMAPKQNAGGEGGTAPAATTDPETGDEDPAGGSGSDTLTTVVASLGLAAGLLALGLVLLGRRQDRR